MRADLHEHQHRRPGKQDMPVRPRRLHERIRAMLNPFAAIVSPLRLLAARRDGSVAIIFGLAAIPVIIGGGMAIDTARAYVVKTRFGAALDGEALAVSFDDSSESTVLTTSLQNYFYNNYCKSVPSGT